MFEFPKQFYHGTHCQVKVLLPPCKTGNIRPSEQDRQDGLDVVFITPNKGYAGVYGRVHKVLPVNPRPYFCYLQERGNRKKADRILRRDPERIWVCDYAIALEE